MATVLTNTPADPAVLFAEEIADLFGEAKHWLDGEPIANEQQAEAVSALMNRARRLVKDADEARAAEKKPHDDAGKAVQAKWKPITSKGELAADTCRQALAPWLRKVEEEQRRAADLARAEADRLAQLALEARQGSATDLQAREDAERLLKIADGARKDAVRAYKQKAHAKGGERAIGLVDVFTPVLTDSCAALRHYRETQPAELREWLLEQARKDVRSGVRSIPGFEIHHERNAR